MKRKLALLLSLCICLSLLAGCNLSEKEPYEPTGDGLTWDDDSFHNQASQQEDSSVQELTLTYFPNVTMNPYFCTDFTNKAIMSLLYQGLFSVDRDYNVEPVLCEKYTISDDMCTYTFYLDGSATFSDGSRVTPEDVRTSLITAKSSQIYSGRFNRIIHVAVQDDGGVTVVLDTAYENFPLLLDVPILKANQQTIARPLGTGPYKFTGIGDQTQLTRRTDWWCTSDLIVTAPSIRLIEAESYHQIRDEFQFGELDLVQAEPGSDHYVEYLCDYELWDSENGIFLYLACNRDSYIFDSAVMRACLTYAIDRTQLAKEFYRGFATPANLPASPRSPIYNQSLAEDYAYNPEIFAKAVSEAGLTGAQVVLVVCREDTLRLKVAKGIEVMLEAAGLDVIVRDYDAANIEYALVATEYDLYLGQTMLSPNMDLSEFFDADGNLSYGGLSDAGTYSLCLQALENHGNFYTLHYTIMEQGLLCPLLFRSYAVYANRGQLTDLTPSRNNVFYYSIGKSMENALIEE